MVDKLLSCGTKRERERKKKRHSIHVALVKYWMAVERCVVLKHACWRQ